MVQRGIWGGGGGGEGARGECGAARRGGHSPGAARKVRVFPARGSAECPDEGGSTARMPLTEANGEAERTCELGSRVSAYHPRRIFAKCVPVVEQC